MNTDTSATTHKTYSNFKVRTKRRNLGEIGYTNKTVKHHEPSKQRKVFRTSAAVPPAHVTPFMMFTEISKTTNHDL